MKEPRESLLEELREIKKTVKEANDIPESMALKNELIRMIGSGILIEGDRLPGVYDMGELMEVNRQTAYKAYKILQQEGFVSIKRQEGVIVHVTVSRHNAGNQLQKNLEKTISEAYASNLTYDDIITVFEDKASKMWSSKMTRTTKRELSGSKE